MNQPKRRGRPPLIALPVVNPMAEPGELQNVKSLDEQLLDAMDRIPLGDTPVIQMAKERVFAQAYADRVWSGQSPDAPRAWRIERVKLALEGQNLPFEGVVLP